MISGPNAGGKSITLKMVQGLHSSHGPKRTARAGALQQCLWTVQEILTDIEDNQSIENQLSTYSYRLKRMKELSEAAGGRTPCSCGRIRHRQRPELGGAGRGLFRALREEGFGVITTHYANIKTRATLHVGGHQRQHAV